MVLCQQREGRLMLGMNFSTEEKIDMLEAKGFTIRNTDIVFYESDRLGRERYVIKDYPAVYRNGKEYGKPWDISHKLNGYKTLWIARLYHWY